MERITQLSKVFSWTEETWEIFFPMRDHRSTNVIPIYNDVSTLYSERKGSCIGETIHKQQNTTGNQSLSKPRVY